MPATQNKSQTTRQKAQKTAKSAKKVAQPAPKETPKPEPKTARTALGQVAEFVPTADQRQIVNLGAAVGLSRERIAELITHQVKGKTKPISIKTLKKHFAHELAKGRDIVLMKIAGTMVSIATDRKHKGCVTAGIWLQKTWGRMREPEPEWSEQKRMLDAAETAKSSGWTVIDARPVLEEPKPEPLQLSAPETSE